MSPEEWQDYIPLAEHYKAIDKTNIYLYVEKQYPWEYVSDISSAGSYRLNVPVSLRVSAAHPCGLTFSWNFELENSSANGTSRLQLNMEHIKEINSKFPIEVKIKLANILKQHTEQARKELTEYEDFVQGMRENYLNLFNFVQEISR